MYSFCIFLFVVDFLLIITEMVLVNSSFNFYCCRFFLPVSMVICNDIFAYIFGKMYFIVSKRFFMNKSLYTIEKTPTMNT